MSTSNARTAPQVFITLSVMMFFLFFIWGSWLVTMGAYMAERGMDGGAIGWAYSTGPIASIIMPFFIGFLADRYFQAQKVQGILLLIGSIFMFIAPQFATADQSTLFIACLFGHTFCYMPTLGLSNTICLKHLKDSEAEYPRVRVFATLGWIVAGLAVSFIFKGETNNTILYLPAVVSVLVGLYSFTLQSTPPAQTQSSLEFNQLIGKDTWPYFKKASFAIFMFGSLLACVAFYPYWPFAAGFLGEIGIERTAATLSLAQISELFVLALVLPYALKKWGIKITLLVGMLSWIVRYLLFAGAAYQPSIGLPLALGAIILHGFAYDFVFVSGYLYVDKNVGENVRAQAQALLVVFTQGIGFLIGSQFLVGKIQPAVVEADKLSTWGNYWIIPAIYLSVIFFLLLLFFKAPREEKKEGAS